jgi:ubiquinone/menaquinone biosynthesis C-methylase UbiE
MGTSGMDTSGERSDRMATRADRHAAPGTKGRVLHAAAGYDLLVWLYLLGRERQFRDRLLDLARLAPGEAVLDIGCGTGSLAIAARGRVGAGGAVDGLDASAEMIARARRKAAKAGADVAFTVGVVETLPYPDARFDVVLSTLMLHHLPAAAREQCMREMRRVVKPGGRVLAVDFGARRGERRGFLAHIHRHGGVALDEIVALLRAAGFEVVDRGEVGLRNLNFALASAR